MLRPSLTHLNDLSLTFASVCIELLRAQHESYPLFKLWSYYQKKFDTLDLSINYLTIFLTFANFQSFSAIFTLLSHLR